MQSREKVVFMEEHPSVNSGWPQQLVCSTEASLPWQGAASRGGFGCVCVSIQNGG